MKNIVMLIVFLFILINYTYSQLELYIEKITVYNVVYDTHSNVFTEAFLEGPSICTVLCIKNDSDSNMYIDFYNSEWALNFYYNGKTYYSKVYNIIMQQNDSIILGTGQKVKGEFCTYLFVGTDILKKNPDSKGEYNYIEELLQVLPTISVTYKAPNCKLVSTSIKCVEVIGFQNNRETRKKLKTEKK
jgi:hypothetical protein